MKVNVYLQLAPEFGGTKFGPFEGAEIRLGCDPSRNDIVLPETLGVLPEHVKILKQSNDNYVIAPTERTAAVFVYRVDGRPPKQVVTPVAVGPGDGFALVTAEGPRFFIIVEMPQEKRDGPKTQFDKNIKGLSVASFWAEIKRQGIAKATTTQAGYIWRNVGTFIKSGAIFSPRNIIMLVMSGSGWVFAGAAGCGACLLQNHIANLAEANDDLKGQVAVCAGGSEDEPDVPTLTAQVLAEKKWQDTLLADDTLRKAYIEELKQVFADEQKYRWVYTKANSPFVQWAKTLQNDTAIPREVSRVLSYAAAIPTFVEGRDWHLIQQNSDRAETCARGPAPMTFRQAKNLGLNTQLDALVEGHLATNDDLELKKEALLQTWNKTGQETPYDFKGAEIEAAAGLPGNFACLFVTGEDDRMNLTAMKKALRQTVGQNAQNVPEVTRDYWVAARLMRYYAADWRYGYAELKFDSKTPPTASLGEASDDQKSWVVNNTARTMARAVAVPCMARLDPKKGKEPPETMANGFPSLVQCGILRLLIERGDL